VYIVQNPLFDGNFFSSVKNIFSSNYFGNYFPIHLLSYLIEIKLFGYNPFFFHLDNIILHIFNAFFIFLLFYKLTAKSMPAFTCAVLFAVHPIHCESVAWVSERKDTLYLFFMLASFIVLLGYYDKRKFPHLIFSLILYILSVLSKSTSIVFPFLVLITLPVFKKAFLAAKRDYLTLVPYFFISTLIVVIQMTAEESYGGWGEKISFFMIADIIVRYLFHVSYPINLSPRYSIEVSSLSPLLIFIISLILIYSCSKKRFFRWSFLWFLTGLLPVLNIIPIQIKMADRYMYLPGISLYFLFSLWADNLLNSNLRNKKIVITSIIFLITFLCIRNISYTRTFSNTKSLWQRVLSSDRNDPSALLNIAIIDYNSTGNINESEQIVKKVYKLAPSNPEILIKIGKLFFLDGELTKSEQFIREALSIPKTKYQFPESLTIALQIYKQKSDFVSEKKILDIIGSLKTFQSQFKNLNDSFYKRINLYKKLNDNENSNSIDTSFINSALKLYSMGNIDGTKRIINKAIKLNPNNPDLFFLYGLGFLLENDKKRAYDFFSKSINSTNGFFNFFASALINNHNIEIIEDILIKGLKKYDNNPLLYLELAVLYAESGKFGEAEQMLGKALRSNTAWEYIPRSLYVHKLIRISQNRF